MKKRKKICYTNQKFKTGIKLRISFLKVHRVIEFDQNAWIKPYIDMKTDLRKISKKKKIFKKLFLS